ncbi:MAG: S8 family serine peptidase [Phycisphaerales bacterium]|nr:S8 family serine peptidase [Phycisphaerales bacterium]
MAPRQSSWSKLRVRGNLVAALLLMAVPAADVVTAEGGKPAVGNVEEAAAPMVDPAARRVLLRMAPGIEPFVDADGGTWFLPAARGVGGLQAAVSRELRNALDGAEVLKLDRAFTIPASDTGLARKHRLDRYFVVELDSAVAAHALLADLVSLRGLGGVLEHVELDGVGGVASTPDDEYFNLQYGLRNTGQLISGQSGTPGSDCSVPDAWSWSIGDSDLTVAVLDSGMNEHLEYEHRMLTGRNVPGNNSNTVDQCGSHGTHVTGVIAAQGNNEDGIAGVAWGVQLLPVVVVQGCTGYESWCAEGITWAADNGADLINMSLQYSAGTELLSDAVAYADALGVIQVAASGNSGGSNDVQAPGRFEETIAVAALDNRDQRWSSSSQGPEVDLAAAGWQVFSTTNTASYGFSNGTSMAAPMVTGIAALLKSLDSSLDPAQVRMLMQDSAVDIGGPGHDYQTGSGRPDAWAAIQLLDPEPPLDGDLNRDGHVDGVDFGLLLVQWGPCGDCEDTPCSADLDGNCVVDGIDIGLLLADWTP